MAAAAIADLQQPHHSPHVRPEFRRVVSAPQAQPFSAAELCRRLENHQREIERSAGQTKPRAPLSEIKDKSQNRQSLSNLTYVPRYAGRYEEPNPTRSNRYSWTGAETKPKPPHHTRHDTLTSQHSSPHDSPPASATDHVSPPVPNLKRILAARAAGMSESEAVYASQKENADWDAYFSTKADKRLSTILAEQSRLQLTAQETKRRPRPLTTAFEGVGVGILDLSMIETDEFNPYLVPTRDDVADKQGRMAVRSFNLLRNDWAQASQVGDGETEVVPARNPWRRAQEGVVRRAKSSKTVRRKEQEAKTRPVSQGDMTSYYRQEDAPPRAETPASSADGAERKKRVKRMSGFFGLFRKVFS